MRSVILCLMLVAQWLSASEVRLVNGSQYPIELTDGTGLTSSFAFIVSNGCSIDLNAVAFVSTQQLQYEPLSGPNAGTTYFLAYWTDVNNNAILDCWVSAMGSSSISAVQVTPYPDYWGFILQGVLFGALAGGLVSVKSIVKYGVRLNAGAD